MDFHSLCQKINVDNIRAKFPPLPALPALPQIKLPKSMPKIKSRKIFRTSRENINRNGSPKHGQQQQEPMGSQPHLALPPIPPAGFIRQTPTRISTISSLMLEESGDGSTYRSAGSIDDVYPLSRRYSYNEELRPISPIRAPSLNNPACTSSSTSNVRMSLTERLHRSYKDLSDFRFKHIFVKKTIVRKDSIQVEQYVEHYKADLLQEAKEQERRDLAIADNYTFRFKLSQQNLEHSNSVTPDDSPRSEQNVARYQGRTVGEHSGDESGMETSPPQRKPGIASTRFARVRQSSSEREVPDSEEKFERPAPVPSALWSTKINRTQLSSDAETSRDETDSAQIQKSKTKFSYKDRVRRLTSYISTQEDSDAPVTQTEDNSGNNNNLLSKIKGLGKRSESTEKNIKIKRKNTLNSSPNTTDDEEVVQPKEKSSPTQNAFNSIKHNFKRIQQSIKTRQKSNQEDSGDQPTTSKNENTSTTAEKLALRLRRFRSRDVSTVDLDDEDGAVKTTSTSNQSPIRQVITNKLENWKKSFKKRSNDKTETQPSEDETSPEKEKPNRQTRSDTLIKKLKHIRTRKCPDSKDEQEDAQNSETEAGGDDAQQFKSKSTRFKEARQRTLKRMNEKMQQMKFFHKSQEQIERPRKTNTENRYHSEEEDWDESPTHEGKTNESLSPTGARRDLSTHNEYNAQPENNKPMSNVHTAISIPTARAAWTTKPPNFSESLESDIDPSEFPRVLIHQDNSDSFESTLIIAVTRSPSTASNRGPQITEIPLEKEFDDIMKKTQMSNKSEQFNEWVPNKNIINEFLQATPPKCVRKRSLEKNTSQVQNNRVRRRSMESNSNSDSDSWIPENKRKDTIIRGGSKVSQASLIRIDETNEAWKVHTEQTVENTTLYKTKSIDIFEKSVLKGGVLTAFEDFDDELRNEPIQRIAIPRSADSIERDSSEDTADDDNSSRITKIEVNRVREGSTDSGIVPIPEKKQTRGDKLLQHYANSRESLIANFDENEEKDSIMDTANEEEDDLEDDSDDDDDRPPSAAPSPPPKILPPPPPLPQRKPSVRQMQKITVSESQPPPLPKSEPPLPPPVATRQIKSDALPRIPERTSSMPRAAKPLVKTSSLRLVFSEQVKPADVGKVNKLISRFDGNSNQRPRVIPRRMQQDESEDYSDIEEDFAAMADKLKERYANIIIERDTTPTPTNTPKINTPEAKESPQKIMKSNNNNEEPPMRIRREIIAPMVVTTTDEDNNTQIIMQQTLEQRPSTESLLDSNFNTSCTNSEYGSPMEYPSSLRGSLETIPILERKDVLNQRIRSVDKRSRRSMTREDDNFYSFDSDEENSYYSISSTGSNRYIVEL